MNDNPKLKKPPLVEALFEVRFTPTMDYSFFNSEIFNHFKTEIEKSESLIPDGIPEFPGQILIRNRFVLKDNLGLIQTGRGVLSINQLKYNRFENFMALINKVLNVFFEIERNVTIKRVGLRYINKIALDKEWKDIISIIVAPPEQIQNGLDTIHYKFIVNKSSVGFMQITVANPIKQESRLKEVVIDLDHFKDVNIPVDIENIATWIAAAHQNIYDTFINCLTPQFKEEIK